LYSSLKFLHVLGAVLLIGNVTVTAVWKVFADRTRNAATVAYAQRLVTYTDWAFTGGGILLLMVGGYGMVLHAGLSLTQSRWLLWGQIMFVASGLMWLFILVPIQITQSKMSSTFGTDQLIPDDYWRLARRWITWGVIATVPIVIALYLMVAKAP
jgi:uncharacterized membrane protein